MYEVLNDGVAKAVQGTMYSNFASEAYSRLADFDSISASAAGLVSGTTGYQAVQTTP